MTPACLATPARFLLCFFISARSNTRVLSSFNASSSATSWRRGPAVVHSWDSFLFFLVFGVAAEAVCDVVVHVSARRELSGRRATWVLGLAAAQGERWRERSVNQGRL